MPLNLKKYRHTDARGDRSEILPDMNLSQLADDVDTTRAHISLIINGRVIPGRTTLFLLAEALEGSVEEVDQWLTKLKKKADKLRDE